MGMMIDSGDNDDDDDDGIEEDYLQYCHIIDFIVSLLYP